MHNRLQVNFWKLNMNAIIIIEDEGNRKLYDNAAKYFERAETTLILTLKEINEYFDELDATQNRRQLSDKARLPTKLLKTL